MNSEVISNAQAAELLGVKVNTLDQKRRRLETLEEGEHWFKDAGASNALMWTAAGLQAIAQHIDTDAAIAYLGQQDGKVTTLSVGTEAPAFDGIPTEDIAYLDALAEELAAEAIDSVRASYTANRAAGLISQQMRDLEPTNPQRVKQLAGEILAARLGRAGVHFSSHQSQQATVEVEA